MSKVIYEGGDKIKIEDRALPLYNIFTDVNANDLRDATNDNDTRLAAVETGSANPTNVSALWTTGLSFDCIASSFPINKTYYAATPITLTLSNSDATLDRIDLIVAKIPTAPVVLGTIEIIEGTLATPELVVPPDYDPGVYFVIKQVIVRAAATVPTDSNGVTTSIETVYADGTGEPNEWTFSSNSANIVNSGGVINATNAPKGTYATLTNNDAITGLNSDRNFSLSFDITLKETSTREYIFIRLRNAENKYITNTFYFTDGDYNFSLNSLTKQSIIIDGSDFTTTRIGDIYKVEIFFFSGGLGYLLDNIKFNVGSGTDTTTQPTTSPEYRLGANVADKVPLLRDGVQVSELDLTPYVGGSEQSQITITTAVSITTDTTSGGLGQSGKNTVVDNGVNAINITVNGGVNFVASYIKHGTGAITFVQGTGRTLVQVDSTAGNVLDGSVGSTATISSIGTTDYLRISNAN